MKPGTLYTPTAARLFRRLYFEQTTQQIDYARLFVESPGGSIFLSLREYPIRCKNVEKLMAKAHLQGYVEEFVIRRAVATNPQAVWLAQKELRETGEIKGYLFLEEGLEMIWLSHYGFSCLKEVKE